MTTGPSTGSSMVCAFRTRGLLRVCRRFPTPIPTAGSAKSSSDATHPPWGASNKGRPSWLLTLHPATTPTIPSTHLPKRAPTTTCGAVKVERLRFFAMNFYPAKKNCNGYRYTPSASCARMNHTLIRSKVRSAEFAQSTACTPSALPGLLISICASGV